MMTSPAAGLRTPASGHPRTESSPFPSLEAIALPAPRMDRNITLMQALRRRHSTRAFLDRPAS